MLDRLKRILNEDTVEVILKPFLVKGEYVVTDQDTKEKYAVTTDSVKTRIQYDQIMMSSQDDTTFLSIDNVVAHPIKDEKDIAAYNLFVAKSKDGTSYVNIELSPDFD